ncbi:MAG: hypothetical protein C0408_00690 [Odoribacter sp.]|nr:hypothetical protein [Odoribacter sp.]
MRTIYLIILVVLFSVSGCKKDSGPRLSGTDTIDNILSKDPPYYAFGFSFPASQKVSTLNSPLDVFTINAFPGNFDKTYFDCQNFNNSFYRYGVYADAAAASLAFKNLASFSVTEWKAVGDSVKSNQIWLFKTSSDTYAKFRIISSIGEIRDSRPYVECTFEWVYLPDGSLTFPVK